MANLEQSRRETSNRQRVSLTIAKSVLDEAKLLEVNLSQAGESGIASAIKRMKEERWREENAEGIAAHNARIEREGTLLTPLWAQD